MFGRSLRGVRTITSTPWADRAWGSWPGEGYGPTAAGVTVTSDNATQLLTVYASDRFICDQIGLLPVDVFRRVSPKESEEIKRPGWLDEPMPGVPWEAWVSQVVSSWLLDGDAFIARFPSQSGQTLALVPLDPGTVQIRREGGGRAYYVNGNRPTFDLIHVPALMRAGADRGMSPVEAARQTIGGGMAAEEFAGRFFGQGATMAGVITVPGALPPEGPSSPKELARAFMRAHSGKNKAHLPAVLQGGAQWTNVGVTQEQAQFLETRKFTDAQIAGQMFLIDPTELGIAVEGTSITYANLEQRAARRVQVTLMPWIVRLERMLSALLASPRYVKLNTNATLRGDTKTRYEAYALGITNGFLLPNEARAWEELPPLPEPQSPPEESPPEDPPADDAVDPEV